MKITPLKIGYCIATAMFLGVCVDDYKFKSSKDRTICPKEKVAKDLFKDEFSLINKQFKCKDISWENALNSIKATKWQKVVKDTFKIIK